MIEPILKLDREPDPPQPAKRSSVMRWLVLGVALCALFAGVTVAMLLALPAPHTQADYMMAGGLATMVALLAFFGAVLTTQFRGAEAFYKKRSK
jgi:hypothetical protein